MKVFITISNYQRIVCGSRISKEWLKYLQFYNDLINNKCIMDSNILESIITASQYTYSPLVKKESHEFINTSKTPSYHFYDDCQFLLSDFTGMHLPDVINLQGIEKIIEFQEWFKNNRNKLDNIDEFNHIFFEKWGFEFDLIRTIYENSGITSFENDSLIELEGKINKLLSEYCHESSSDLINLLQKYYKIIWNTSSRKEDLVLNRLGFQVCTRCKSQKEINECVKEREDKEAEKHKQIMKKYKLLKDLGCIK